MDQRPTTAQASLFALIVSFSTAGQQPHTLSGDIQIHRNFYSKLLNNQRDVLVYLPAEYKQSSRRHYSVLYLHDGQNVFDEATSFIPGQEWRVDETAQSLISSAKVEPLIIVAIYNSGKDRIDEYTPVRDEKHKAGGRADLYGRMLVEELKPFIDVHYRTKPGAKHTGLGGSSLGGLVSLYLGLKYPHVFSRLAVISPSIWFANKQIIQYVEALQKRPKLRIWLDTGTSEGHTEQESEITVLNARLLKEILRRKGWRLDKDLRYFEAMGAGHSERAWSERIAPLLEFLFPRK